MKDIPWQCILTAITMTRIYSSVEAFGKDIKKLQEMLYEITDVKPTIYRFPGGSSNSCAGDIKPYIQYIDKEGLLYFDWNALSEMQ